MQDSFKRFDMAKPPRKTLWCLKPVKKLLSAPAIKQHKPNIHYVNGSESIKGPFLLLCNHNAFLDFKVATACLKDNDANYVVAIDGFIKREWLLRDVGCICKRKFTNDITLIKQLKRAINMENVAVIYPEARYSLCGTTAVLPKSLGRLAKMLDVPLVTLICHGHHVNSPFWDSSHERGVKPTEATYKVLLTKEQVENTDADKINELIVNEFQYDDFKWQKDNNIIINDPNRAKGLHRVLYQCPHCKKEYQMDSFKTTLKCNACGKEWEMTELGELKAKEGETEFSHIPDWYEWERANVKAEVENGTYSTGLLNVEVKSLPNSKGYIKLGEGTLIHDKNGFKCETTTSKGEKYEMNIPVQSMYSCHIEYQYLFKFGDCIDLNTLTDTWYIYPKGNEFAVTKIALATEELYFKYQRDKGINMPKGLA